MKFVLAFACAGFALGQGGPYQRQPVDPAAATRGRAVYTQHCINCHGALAKGTEDAPDLLRSPLVLRDRLGNELGPALQRLPDHKRDLSNTQVLELTHFLKDQIEHTATNRNPAQPPNVLTGNADRGRAFFNGKGKCNTCHSITGDLAGVGRRFSQPVDLQQRTMFPRRTKPVMVTVTPQGQAAVTGELVRVDDFEVALKTSSGAYRSWQRGPNLRVDVQDPLQPHWDLLDLYTDQDMHDVVTYLDTLK